jgi:hypothetical protein
VNRTSHAFFDGRELGPGHFLFQNHSIRENSPSVGAGPAKKLIIGPAATRGACNRVERGSRARLLARAWSGSFRRHQGVVSQLFSAAEAAVCGLGCRNYSSCSRAWRKKLLMGDISRNRWVTRWGAVGGSCGHFLRPPGWCHNLLRQRESPRGAGLPKILLAPAPSGRKN